MTAIAMRTRAYIVKAYLAETIAVGRGPGSFDNTQCSPVMVMG